MQLGVTSYCLYGLRRFSAQFLTVAVIQINPFQMTLRRKNLISTWATIFMYGVELLLGVFVSIYETDFSVGLPMNCGFTHGMIIDLAVFLRMGPRLPVLRYIQDNKFLMWLTIGLLLRWLRPMFDQHELPPGLVVFSLINKTFVLALFLWKGFLHDIYQRRPQASKNV
jgi:hypothetical protein